MKTIRLGMCLSSSMQSNGVSYSEIEYKKDEPIKSIVRAFNELEEICIKDTIKHGAGKINRTARGYLKSFSEGQTFPEKPYFFEFTLSVISLKMFYHPPVELKRIEI